MTVMPGAVQKACMTDRPVEEPVEVSVVTDARSARGRPAGLELSLDPYPGVSAGVRECHDVWNHADPAVRR